MRKGRFQHTVATSSFTLPVAAFITTLLWLIEGGYTLDRLWGWSLCGLTTYFWLETANTNALIRIRSLLTPALYSVMMGVMFALHPLQDSLAVSCCMLASYHQLFKSYQQPHAVFPLFHSFLCLSIGSLFFPQLLFFVPLYFGYTATLLRSLNWHTFWAAVIGLLLPYWFYACYHLYAGNLGYVGIHLQQLTEFQPLKAENYTDRTSVITAATLLLFNIIAGLHCLRTGYNDKIRTRLLLYLILTQQFFTNLFLFFQPVHFNILFGLSIMNSAPILSHYFALTNTRISHIIFVLFLLSLMARLIFSLWIQ